MDANLHTQIHDALNSGDVEHAISLVRDNDVDMNFRDVIHDMQTLLMKICYVTLDITSLQTLLEVVFDKSPDVNIQDTWGRTALMHACIANKPGLIEGLLEYESTNVSSVDFDGNSALSYAVQNCDVYTLEDILHHKDGPRLLGVHNTKDLLEMVDFDAGEKEMRGAISSGQTPYTIAEKGSDQAVLRLFDSHLNKSARLQHNKHKSRRPKHHHVYRLPPAHTPSPDRSSSGGASSRGNHHAGSPVGQQSGGVSHRGSHYAGSPVAHQGSVSPRMHHSGDENKLLNRPTLNMASMLLQRNNGAIDIPGKCDSAPVTRSASYFDQTEMTSSLKLSSPRLARRHHKQDCLLTETITPNTARLLPPMASFEDKDTDCMTERFLKECGIRTQRRPSLSLPDLRNVTGSLVSSGNPGSRVSIPTIFTPDEDSPDDDVFSSSYPSLSSRSNKTIKVQRKELTLPDINKRTVTLTSDHASSHSGVSSLVRLRKYSTSDDQLQRITLK